MKGLEQTDVDGGVSAADSRGLTAAPLAVGATSIDDSEGQGQRYMLRPRANVPPGVRFGGRPAVVKRIENAILVGVPLFGSVLAAFHIVGRGLTWIDLSAFVVFYVLVGLGVALGFHRYFSHKSFETMPALAFLLGALGSMAFQGSVLRWIIDHHRHHAHADASGDVHSPVVDQWGRPTGGIKGLWHAHAGWLFDETTTDPAIYGANVHNQKLVRFFHRTHWLWPILSLALPFAYGYGFGGVDAGWSALLVGGCLRTTVLHNVVWSVNSIGHYLGDESFSLHNASKNNFVLAMLTFGDGWHNNHHRYPRSAWHGLGRGELDVNGLLIAAMERAGLAWDVIKVRPSLPE
jgi:stearoyl-CoA desaturase (Delta-9 desaturase)